MEGSVMKRCVALAALVSLCCFQAAFAALDLTMAREVIGLSENGTLEPGTTTLDFVVTLTAEGEPDELTALAVEEILPRGFAYVSVQGAPAPNVAKFNEATGVLQFLWFDPLPEFPFVFSYRVNIVEPPNAPVRVRGQAKYRTDGGELLSNEVETEIGVPSCLSLMRDIPSVCYTPGAPLEVGLTLDSECVDQITALSIEEVLPDGFAFASVSSDPTPNLIDFDEETRTLLFLWFEPIPAISPTFSLSYMVNVEAGLEGEVVIQGRSRFRTDGPELGTATVSTVVCGLDVLPPVITLNGPDLLLAECGAPYMDPGATALDSVDGSVPVTTLGLDAVDTSTPGDYVLTYTAVDRSGNEAFPRQRTVRVVDRTPPRLTLLGPSSQTVECSTPYVDPGAGALDTCEGDISGRVEVSGAVDTATPGDYVLTYTVADLQGNPAAAKNRTVRVIDTRQPILTLVGAAVATVECGGNYADAGAFAEDACSGDLTAQIVVFGTVNTGVPGEYRLTYNVSDFAGNAAAPIQRVVHVADRAAPVIALLGQDAIEVECGSLFEDPGATATDVCDGNLTNRMAVESNVSTAAPGVYTVRYRVTDGAGNAALPATRTVRVLDRRPPTLRLLGSASLTIEAGSPYRDAGATASDECEGDLTGEIQTENPVDTQVPGDYVVRYNVNDNRGNAAVEVTRSVRVVDSRAPVITLTGGPLVTIDCGSGAFQDPGVRAIDNLDGDISARVVATGAVDTSTPGDYLIRYSVVDNAGNAAMESRTVRVLNTPAQLREVIITSPEGDLLVPQGAVSSTLGFSSSVFFSDDGGCFVGLVEVVYEVDGLPVASSRDARNGYPASTVLPLGDFSVVAIATLVDTGAQVMSDPVNVRIQAAQDVNANGFLDSPFQALAAPGDGWLAEVAAENCAKAVRMVRWMGDCGAPDPSNPFVTATVALPGDPSQSLTVSVPRGLLECGQDGILVVSIACDLESLLGPVEAARLAVPPTSLVAGGVYFEVSVLVSANGGQSYAELDNALVAGQPIYLALNGLAFNPGTPVSFYAHPTQVIDAPGTGLDILGSPGSWSRNGVVDAITEGATLTARTRSLSVFAPFEVAGGTGVLTTSPSPQGDLVLGIVVIGETIRTTVRVTNTGGDVVSGNAVLSENPEGAFGLAGVTSYSLANGQGRDIEITFSPDAAADFRATLTFTGVDPPVTLRLFGKGVKPEDKPFRILGCGAPGAVEPGGNLGDLLCAAGFMSLLLVFSRGRLSVTR